MIIPVILSGVSGTRLWPLSRTLFQKAIHRIENREKTPLEIIEIQTGDYLDEDDIIRLEDDFERN